MLHKKSIFSGKQRCRLLGSGNKFRSENRRHARDICPKATISLVLLPLEGLLQVIRFTPGQLGEFIGPVPELRCLESSLRVVEDLGHVVGRCECDTQATNIVEIPKESTPTRFVPIFLDSWIVESQHWNLCLRGRSRPRVLHRYCTQIGLHRRPKSRKPLENVTNSRDITGKTQDLIVLLEPRHFQQPQAFLVARNVSEPLVVALDRPKLRLVGVLNQVLKELSQQPQRWNRTWQNTNGGES
mmetsp:Transcript_38139/g.91605  ORF Transcript_38139/g.91605 Transcript_38139/m.91605 type:complete len:242 (-) Transcript_38139:446-1171(-)